VRPSGPAVDVAAIAEDVLGCKWTLHILQRIRAGRRRPGVIRAGLPGLANKVLNERLRKLVRFGLISRTAFPEVPPRVEYTLTPLGRRFVKILDQIERLQAEIDGAARG